MWRRLFDDAVLKAELGRQKLLDPFAPAHLETDRAVLLLHAKFEIGEAVKYLRNL